MSQPPHTAYPPNPFQSEPMETHLAGIPSGYLEQLGMGKSYLYSVLAHVGLPLLIFLLFLIFQLLGISLISFDPPKDIQDVEFQLVDAPKETPRNPKTRNRAVHNTRSGGEKIPNVREAQSQRMAGAQQPKPTPQAAPAPKPVKVSATPPRTFAAQSAPLPTPKVSQAPSGPVAPPRPKITAPKPSNRSGRATALPNPLAPIQVPDAPSAATETGPLVRQSGSGGSGSGSGTNGGKGAVGPSTAPGQFASGSGRPNGQPGGPSGQGGSGTYSQHGSPGGGGGRPGVDALAEPDFGPYLAELQRRIRRNWHPPEDKEDKSVILIFTVTRDGRLTNIRTKRSSGFANADDAAAMAIKASAPFRPLPAEYRNNSINVEFTFDYNVFTGGGGGISRR